MALLPMWLQPGFPRNMKLEKKQVKDITIRGFQPEDINQVSTIIAESFKDKFQKLTNISEKNMPDFLNKTGIIHATSFPGYLVATEGKKIYGVMVLKWKNQQRKKEKQSLRKAASYGWKNIIKLNIGLWLLHHSPTPKECYIEHIAVKETIRGKQVGTQLINYGKKFASELGFTQYTLYVASSNKQAIKLYKKLGFHTQTNEKSYLTSLLFNIDTWHYMTQDLSIISD